MIEQKEIHTSAIRFCVEEDGNEVGHAYLYFISNDAHDKSYGYMEDVFVESSHRGKGYGRQLVNAVVACARARGCYKLVGTSRYGRDHVHTLYTKLGFADHGKTFRIDF